METPTTRFTTSSLKVCLTVLLKAHLFPGRSSLALGFLCRCCIPGPSIVPSRPSVLYYCAFTPCRNGTAGQPSSSRGQLLPGHTIALDPFLRLSVTPYCLVSVPISVLQCYDSFCCGLFLRDFLMHRYGLRISSIGLQIRDVHFVRPFF